MVNARRLLEFSELPTDAGVEVETGYRHDTDCEGRAVFDLKKLGGKEVRYSLSALWEEALPLLFGIGLNPSTARARKGDRTVNRVIREARATQVYGGVFWINLAAQMETNADTFIKDGRAKGRLNDEQIRKVLLDLHPEEGRRDVLLAWGDDGPKLSQWLSQALKDPRVRIITFGLTEKERPRHPSRLRRDAKLTLGWSVKEAISR